MNNSPIPTLQLDNVDFEKKGVSLVVMRGAKWDLGQEIINIANKYSSTVLYGIHCWTKTMKFSDLTDDDLIYEHESYNTVKELKLKLGFQYPDFDTREIITLLYFELL